MNDPFDSDGAYNWISISPTTMNITFVDDKGREYLTIAISFIYDTLITAKIRKEFVFLFQEANQNVKRLDYGCISMLLGIIVAWTCVYM